MRYVLSFVLAVFLISCGEVKKDMSFTSVDIELLVEDTMSVRAIDLIGNSLAFAANKGIYGSVNLTNNKVLLGKQRHLDSLPEFRAVGHTSNDFFMLSAGTPALLYKTGSSGKMELVYKEVGEKVFYDSMLFWNDTEGIAVGDAIGNCLSIIITRDGGNTWRKMACDELPEAKAGEGAFAASNTNITSVGNYTWIATSFGRVYFSEDKGRHWVIQETPITAERHTQGIFSINFYDEDLGVIIGGDFTDSQINKGNKAFTQDGGNTWELVAEGYPPGYMSCIQFVPNSRGKQMVAVGYTGINYSKDSGKTWQNLSKEGFYTIRFQNDSIAFAAGKNRIAKLHFIKRKPF